jgi:hypothetical protein
VTTPQGDLAEIRRLLADHERRLYPVDRNGLPEPTRRRKRGDDMDGQYWLVDRWSVVALAKAEDRDGCVYVHTPHSLIGNEDGSSGDMVAVPYAKARELAAALLAAVHHSEDELARKRGGQ